MKSCSVKPCFQRRLPSGGVVAVAPICSVEQLPAGEGDQSLSVGRRCERYSWHMLARELLGDREAQFAHNEVGAPLIEDSELSISVSHSQQLVAVVVSPERAAVDIEACDRNFERVASRYLSKREMELFGESQRRLAQVWSIKETAYKYAGRKGLSLLDICVESIEDETFTASYIGGESFEGTLTEVLGHTLAFVG